MKSDWVSKLALIGFQDMCLGLKKEKTMVVGQIDLLITMFSLQQPIAKLFC